MEDKKMTLVEHFAELRKRIIIIIVFVIIFSVISYIYVEEIIDFLTRIMDEELVYISPAEAFLTQIKVSIFAGFIVALPIILYQIWSFVLPALKKNERKYLTLLVPVSYILFLAGTVFALIVIIPFGIRFFLGFSSSDLQAMFSIRNYISFVIAIVIPFGLVFQLPLLVFFLTKINLINSHLLARKRKYIIIIMLLLAAILTPPDIISQIMMVVPLLVLYEGSIILAKIIE